MLRNGQFGIVFVMMQSRSLLTIKKFFYKKKSRLQNICKLDQKGVFQQTVGINFKSLRKLLLKSVHQIDLRRELQVSLIFEFNQMYHVHLR